MSEPTKDVPMSPAEKAALVKALLAVLAMLLLPAPAVGIVLTLGWPHGNAPTALVVGLAIPAGIIIVIGAMGLIGCALEWKGQS